MGMSRVVKTTVPTARPGEVYIDGGNGGRVELGFQFGAKLEQERKNPMLLCIMKLLYGAKMRLVTLRSMGGRQHRDEAEHGFVLSTMWEKRMRTKPLLVDILRTGMVDWARLLWRWCWACLLGCCWAASTGKVQVRFSLIFYFSIFSVLYFLFSILFVEFKFEFNSALQIFANTFNLAITS
jgi:hypothetical protein